jgi:hypothetical protein
MRANRELVLFLVLACSCASAQPFEIEVASASAGALQDAIDRCPRSYGARQVSCQIKLPGGTIRGHWKIGGNTTMTTQVAICLIGQGPGVASTAPDGAIGAGGTTLAYDGPPGGTLIDVAAGDFLCLRDLTLAMDGAAVGLRISAKNPASATTQYPYLERVAIRGNAKRPAGIGLLISGATGNDQIDAMLAQSLQVEDVDVGIEVRSHQAVTNRIGPGSKITGQSAAVRIRGGSLSLDGVLAQCRTANCCVYDLLYGAGYFRVRDGYHEIGLPPAQNAKLLCLLRGSPPAAGSWHAVSITESYINVQCDSSAAPCSIDVLDGSSNAGVIFRDNWIAASGGAGPLDKRYVRVQMRGPAGTPRLVWAGNIVASGMKVLSQIDPRVRVEAIASDEWGRIWNDRNLDGQWDSSEPRMTNGQ